MAVDIPHYAGSAAPAAIVFAPTIDLLADDRTIVDLGGSKVRLVFHVSYTFTLVLTKLIGARRQSGRGRAHHLRAEKEQIRNDFPLHISLPAIACLDERVARSRGDRTRKVSDMAARTEDASSDLLVHTAGRRFATIMADPPWRFQNATGKVAPGHKRLNRYGTMTLDEIKALPVARIAADTAHLYLWVPNALLPAGLAVMEAWGFRYKANIVWHKIRKDGGSDGRGVGFYFRNVTELLLFGVTGQNARTLAPGRTQVNMLQTRKREHSRKPDEQYDLIESCSPGPYLEMFGRGIHAKKWTIWGNQADDDYAPTWTTYAHHSQAGRQLPAE